MGDVAETKIGCLCGYSKARIKEISSHVGTAITMLPMFFDLENWQIGCLMIVGILLFGVPEDKAIQMLTRKK